jgi:phosphotriesterase-related protein
MRAGVIEVAGERDELSRHEMKCFRAAAQTQQQTGAPILTHTEEGTAALEQIEVLATAGADLKHVVLSHLDRNFDVNTHRKVLSSGVLLEYDSAFRWKTGENPTLQLLMGLLPEFPRQIMLDMDAARRSYWKSFGGAPELSFLLNNFVPRMRDAGIPEETITKIFVDNPAHVYVFCK